MEKQPTSVQSGRIGSASSQLSRLRQLLNVPKQHKEKKINKEEGNKLRLRTHPTYTLYMTLKNSGGQEGSEAQLSDWSGRLLPFLVTIPAAHDVIRR